MTAAVTLLDLPDLDPAIEAATVGAPLWRCERTGIWVAESHALVNAVLTNPTDFSSKVTLTVLDAGFPGSEVEAIYRAGGVPWTRTLQTNDPPDHRRFRALVERVFTPSKVEGMADSIAGHCAQLLAAWSPGARVDAMEAFAIPLPLLVIAEQLGVPAADRAHFKRWSDAAIQAIGLGATRDEHLDAARCGVEFQQYFGPILADPRRRPEGSLVDRVALAAAQPDTPLTLPEQLSLLHMLMIAGHETTTSTLGSLLALLAERADLADAARGDPRLQKRLIEEVLRLAAPVQGLFRITTRELELGGVVLPARTRICVRLGAANRDAARFPAGDAPTLDGPLAAHLAFGAGIHHCIGAPLARRELAIALEALLQRFMRFEIPADARPLRWSRSVMTRGLLSLPLIGHATP
ncbi:MAG: cytochrome P450 [Steroidobacteraceae bacterium]